MSENFSSEPKRITPIKSHLPQLEVSLQFPKTVSIIQEGAFFLRQRIRTLGNLHLHTGQVLRWNYSQTFAQRFKTVNNKIINQLPKVVDCID